MIDIFIYLKSGIKENYKLAHQDTNIFNLEKKIKMKILLHTAAINVET